MTALEKFAAILEEIQKEAGKGLPGGRARLLPQVVHPGAHVQAAPVSAAEQRTHRAMGEFFGRGAGSSQRPAASISTGDKPSVRLQAARFTEPTEKGLSMLQPKRTPYVSPAELTKKRLTRAAAGQDPSSEVVKGRLERKWEPVETAEKVRSELRTRAAEKYRAGKGHAERVLTQRAFEASKAAPETLPKYDPGAVALGKKVVEKAKEIPAAAKAKAEARFQANREALKAEVAKRMSWGSLEPKARYVKPSSATV